MSRGQWRVYGRLRAWSHAHAFATSAATSSMTSALSLPNGRGMSSSSRTVLPPTVTVKHLRVRRAQSNRSGRAVRRAAHPLRGFSGLISTAALGASCVSSVCSLSARVLNAPHDLHASITTRDPPFAAAFGFFAAGAAVVALRFGAISSQVPKIFAERAAAPTTDSGELGHRD